MRILVIANPVSGRGKTAETVKAFVECAMDRGHTAVVKFTESRGSAGRIASQIDSGFDRIVVAGGDGTINEVINGAKTDNLPPLITLAAGTANILARELYLPKTNRRLIEVIEAGKIVGLDVGIVNGSKFLMLVSCGFDSLVTRQISVNRPGRLGFRGYIRPIIRSLMEYQPVNLTVTVDGDQKVDGKLVIVQKVKKYGGIFEFSSRASMTSGLFEVCVFPEGSAAHLIKYCLAGFLRISERLPEIQRFMARSVRIDAEIQYPVEVDGDYWGETPVDISLSGDKVRFIVP